MLNSTATLENSLAVSYKLNMQLLYNPAIELFSYPREEKTYIHTHKNMYINGHSSFVPNSPKLETL